MASTENTCFEKEDDVACLEQYDKFDEDIPLCFIRLAIKHDNVLDDLLRMLENDLFCGHFKFYVNNVLYENRDCYAYLRKINFDGKYVLIVACKDLRSNVRFNFRVIIERNHGININRGFYIEELHQCFCSLNVRKYSVTTRDKIFMYRRLLNLIETAIRYVTEEISLVTITRIMNEVDKCLVSSKFIYVLLSICKLHWNIQ